MHVYTGQFDDTKQKHERRRQIEKLAAVSRSMLATNYPGKTGRDFIRSLAADNPDIKITLVDRGYFQRDVPTDKIRDVVTTIPNTDVFRAMLPGGYDLLDVDLFGGLPLYGANAIERCESWHHLVLSFASKYRSKLGLVGAIPTGMDATRFMAEWCKGNKWNLTMGPPLPYKRLNKNEVLGMSDARGPWYYTFYVTR